MFPFKISGAVYGPPFTDLTLYYVIGGSDIFSTRDITSTPLMTVESVVYLSVFLVENVSWKPNPSVL